MWHGHPLSKVENAGVERRSLYSRQGRSFLPLVKNPAVLSIRTMAVWRFCQAFGWARPCAGAVFRPPVANRFFASSGKIPGEREEKRVKTDYILPPFLTTPLPERLGSALVWHASG
jgi:hypothetical protein